MTELTFCNRTIGEGHLPELALSVTDVLDTEAAVQRIGMVLERTEGLECFGSICVRDDLRSPEAFAEVATIASNLWDGGLILESDNAASVVSAMPALADRRPLVCGLDPVSASMVSSMFGCPVSVGSASLEDLLDYVGEVESGDVVLDPRMGNMKSCLENGTDLHRLADELPEADHPFMVKAWSGEYAVALASTAMLRYCSLVVADDVDRDGCEVLDRIAVSAGKR